MASIVDQLLVDDWGSYTLDRLPVEKFCVVSEENGVDCRLVEIEMRTNPGDLVPSDLTGSYTLDLNLVLVKLSVGCSLPSKDWMQIVVLEVSLPEMHELKVRTEQRVED